MIPPASPWGGRRANGLPSADWGALVDLDPRLSEALLDRLASAGVPAYVEPAGGTPDQLVRSVTHPSRPLDRLWVAPDRAEVARSVVTAEVADLTALLAEQDPAATAHGFIQPVPSTAARRVLPPPALPLPPAGGPVGGAAPEPTDPDEVFRQIIADFEREDDHPVPPWPVAEDIPTDVGKRAERDRAQDRDRDGDQDQDRDRDQDRDGDQDRHRRRADTPPPEPPPPPSGRRLRRRTDASGDDALPGWVEPEPLEDDGHYVPPPPPPAPRFSARTLAAVAATVLGVILMFAPGLVGQYAGLGIGLLGVALFVGGVGALIWSMRDSPPTDRGPDDGAVV